MRSIFWKLGLLAVVIIVLGILAWRFWPQLQSKSQNLFTNEADQLPPQYVSFSGNYFFTTPSSHTVDEMTLPGIQLVYSEGAPTQVKSLNELYEIGAVAIQPSIDLADKKGKDFESFISDKVTPDFQNGLKGDGVNAELQTSFAKRAGINTAEIVAEQDGKIVRKMFVIAGKHPAVVVAKEHNDAYVTITSSLKPVEKFALKRDLELIKETIVEILQLTKEKKADQIFDRSTDALKEKQKASDIQGALDSPGAPLDRAITIVGGTYNKDLFTAQFIFTPRTQGEKASPGFMTLKKQKGMWKLENLNLGLAIPTVIPSPVANPTP